MHNLAMAPFCGMKWPYCADRHMSPAAVKTVASPGLLLTQHATLVNALQSTMPSFMLLLLPLLLLLLLLKLVL